MDSHQIDLNLGFKIVKVQDKFPNSEKEIKIAYRKQAKLHHPDTGGDANKFREVQMAYETAIGLLPELRRAYNQHQEKTDG